MLNFQTRILDLVYATAFDPAQWETLLPLLCAALGGAAGYLQSPHLAGSRGFSAFRSHNIDMEAAIVSGNAYIAHDMISPAMFREAAGDYTRVMTAYGVCRQDEIARNPFWQEHLARFEVGDFASLVLHEGGGDWPVLTISRAPRQGVFDPRAFATLQGLARHLRLATKLRYTTLAATAGASAALEALPSACIVFGENGRVVHANARAEVLAAEGRIRLGGGVMAAAGAADNIRLQLAIRAACPAQGAARGGEFSLAGPAGDALLCAIVPLGDGNPFSAGFSHLRAAAFLTGVHSPPRGERLAARLRDLLGLTAAEAGVAARLAAGDTPDDIAEDSHRSVFTVRNQVRGVLSRSGLRRVGELQALGRLLDAGRAT